MKVERTERSEISYARFTPKRVDQSIGFYPEANKPTRVAPTNRWQQAKSRIAHHALATGNSRYVVFGGVGTRRWYRIVTVSQDEAQAFFEEAIANGFFMLKGLYAQGMRRKAARDTTS